jgi:flagellar hook protein FlgE
MYFVKVADNTWNYYILSPDSVSPHAYTATPTQPTGRLIFNEDGTLTYNQQPPGNNLTSGTYPSVTFTYVDDETLQPVDLTASINFTPRGSYGNTTQNGNSFVNYFTGQDGYGPGSLESLEVDNDGMIVGKYSNGESLYVGRVALATFQDTQGLHREGGTMWTETRDSGQPSLNPAEEGGSGSIYGFSLEDANVDMAEEFVDMIVAQRAWQANAKTISTSDQMLADLMNIKR